jgi:uncharacterized protein YjbI with pentapeptide repeats
LSMAANMLAINTRAMRQMPRKLSPKTSKALGNAESALVLDELESITVLDLQADTTVEGVLLEGTELASIEAPSVRITDAALRRVNLSGSTLRRVRVHDVLAETVNIANGSWRYSHVNNTTFTDCAMVGLDVSGSDVGASTFSTCRMDLANLRMSTFNDVIFSNCSLREVDFYESQLRRVRFDGCELQDADFNQAKLESVDFRGSSVANLQGIGSLKGAIIDGSQLIDLAPALASELGIRVEAPDDDE